jgi:hypothetical protein
LLSAFAPSPSEARLSREGEMVIVDGTMVLVLAVGVLAAMWVVVLYGSSFFGPRVD